MNIKNTVKIFEHEKLSTGKYIQASLKNPSLFYSSPKTIAEHIRAYMYVEKNKKGKFNKEDFESILKKNLAYSTSLIYLKGIIEPQIKKQYPKLKDINFSNIKNKLKHIFEQNPDTQFEIKILKDEFSENFLKTIQDFAEKELKAPNAFKITQVEFNKL